MLLENVRRHCVRPWASEGGHNPHRASTIAHAFAMTRAGTFSATGAWPAGLAIEAASTALLEGPNAKVVKQVIIFECRLRSAAHGKE